MTAIEWLVDTLRKEGVHVPKIYESVAEMREKQQLEKAFVDGAFLFRGDDEDNRFNEWFEQFKNK